MAKKYTRLAMSEMSKKIWFLLFSFLFLFFYISGGKISAGFRHKVMNVEVLSKEEIDFLCDGKTDAFMEPQITLGEDAIAYDIGQNMLLIPQSLWEEEFDHKLQVADGKLYFLEDEALKNKAETIRENRVLRLFWVREDQCWMYNVYFTGMPVLSISSEQMTEDGIVSGHMWLYDQYHSSTRYQSAACAWHLRGATTRQYEKAGYRLTLTDKKLSLLGMRRDDDWILNALYDDDGLIHNKLSYDVWRKIAASNQVAYDEGISMEYVELFMDREYVGVYGLLERIDKKALQLDEQDILYKCRKPDVPGADDFYRELTEEMHPVFVLKYPKDFAMEDWEPLKRWTDLFLLDQYEDFDAAVSILNMENAIDYNLFNLLTCGMDNTLKNIYYQADYQGDGNYRMIRVPWDLNMTWGNSWVDDPTCRFNRFQEKNFEAACGWTPDMQRLYEERPEMIGGLMADRWRRLRRSIITRESLYARLDAEFSYLHGSGAYARNLIRWPPGDGDWQDDYMYEYVDRRLAFLDAYIGRMGKAE